MNVPPAAAERTVIPEDRKRKRDVVEEEDPKLHEFLEVMQAKSRSKPSSHDFLDDGSAEPPRKIQARALPEDDSDTEYQEISKARAKSPKIQASVSVEHPIVEENLATTTSIPVDPNATDDEWLRGRTNRLLDLVDPDDLTVQGTTQVVSEHQPAKVPDPDQHGMDVDNATITAAESSPQTEEQDTSLDQIKEHGRLFVRNLPYSASEDDLTTHFAQCGAIEEVSRSTTIKVSPML